ncbi:DUF2294 domain-containing protein [Kyrpidia spormannii]|uniref:DUF2294 domain-containing protein n=2 Tax=Kyrpidia TaxID=1129704 RepID=A0A2K8N7M6_9BACL|nr:MULTISPECIES: DUF2294 domain-containing protein [Kyrpidia]HHY66662.1 DUF2294 domain-containing protein [Alicyclobacillus sp.]ADG05836.1 Protein of unknown function DUF2294 [Kyrpidia tusciae DSM 2912]ATY85334.1 DUF2294 domain-containing protein [Kyrpidia spormannii]MBE3551989.1 DUF2294 domain-containing protein [Kyrpidia tusciae]MCL6576797.1 DUF2294 domain-containing protein [Kyrpidia sp.]
MEESRRDREQAFANLVRAYRKNHIGKGPEKIKVTFFGNWAIAHMAGSLSPVERFIARTDQGRMMIWQARTHMIKELYQQTRPVDMEALVGANFVKLFTDIDVDQDEVVSVFVFDRPIDGGTRMNEL